MVDDMLGLIQAGIKGILSCLGLEKNAPPSQPPPAPATADETSTTDPLVDVLSSPINSSTEITTMDVNNDLDVENTSTLVTIEELISTIGNTTVETQFDELVDNGGTNASLLTTSLISSGGGGGTSHDISI